jgi:hypothetical protein
MDTDDEDDGIDDEEIPINDAGFREALAQYAKGGVSAEDDDPAHSAIVGSLKYMRENGALEAHALLDPSCILLPNGDDPDEGIIANLCALGDSGVLGQLKAQYGHDETAWRAEITKALQELRKR